MRGRAYNRRRGRTLTGAFLIFFAAVVLLGAAFAWSGGRIEVTLPAFSGGETLSREIIFPGETWYALQFSAHQFEEQAIAAAGEHPARGAAGHVYGKDGGWRVLASAYETRAAAQGMLTQLRDAHGVDAAVYVVERPTVTLRLSGEKARLDAAENALDYLRTAAKRLSALSESLDQRTAGAAGAKTSLQSEKETVAALRGAISAAFRGADAPKWLTDVLKSLENALSAALSAEGEALFGAAVKNCLLTVVTGLNDAMRAL